MNGQTYLRNIATVEFVVPDLPPGRYSVLPLQRPVHEGAG